MGLLDQLWDDTVAGPWPDHGFSKLRKYSSFSPSSPAAEDVAPAVTRSITIARPPSLSLPSGESSSVPSSPGSAPDSPFAAATSRRDGWRAFRRKSKIANVDVVRAEAAVGPRSPTVYDWVVISSLD
ncbi:unnamed protein product [Triticum turgidum subsp. durum]|uniref:Auxin-repressed protein n=1 Tax=Triticum turgidum subsp. durum TaxID=4567 RepID=A0A9R0SN00_TRITD|nr:unnamed protein product [Triticum turgidum subsp. durum]